MRSAVATAMFMAGLLNNTEIEARELSAQESPVCSVAKFTLEYVATRYGAFRIWVGFNEQDPQQRNIPSFVDVEKDLRDRKLGRRSELRDVSVIPLEHLKMEELCPSLRAYSASVGVKLLRKPYPPFATMTPPVLDQAGKRALVRIDAGGGENVLLLQKDQKGAWTVGGDLRTAVFN